MLIFFLIIQCLAMKVPLLFWFVIFVAQLLRSASEPFNYLTIVKSEKLRKFGKPNEKVPFD